VQEDYKAIYDRWHRNLPVDAEASTPWHRMIRESIVEADLAGRKVLEIGCGRGGFACWLAHMSPAMRLTAADYSPAAVAMGQSFAASAQLHNIDWCVADIQRLPWPDGCFDTVVSCETIEHVPAPRSAIAELARVLRPGGKLFLTVPNYFNLAGVHRIYRKLVRGERFQEEGQPINHFTLLPQISHWVRRAGIAVLKIRSVNHSVPYPGRPGITLRALESAPFPFPWLGNNSMVIGRRK
jgi:ubiquinone/menaquinone biosynthesis C-methylase UbiE